jgi:hypothetical protein
MPKDADNIDIHPTWHGTGISMKVSRRVLSSFEEATALAILWGIVAISG